MWPDTTTASCLLAGFIPLVLVILRCASVGAPEWFRARSAFVISVWLGYHLSALLYWAFDEPWVDSMLVPEHINTGLLFSAASMVSFYAGATLAGKDAIGSPSVFLREAARLPIVYFMALLGTSFVFFVISIGGVENIWLSSIPRGFGQFNERVGVPKVIQVIRVVNTFLSILACVLGCAYICTSGRHRHRAQVLAGWAGVAVSSLPWVHYFSRIAGAPLVVLALCALLLRPRRVVLGGTALALGALLCWTGYSARNLHMPGLGSFVEAVVNVQLRVAEGEGENLLKSAAAAIDAMGPWTRRASLEYLEGDSSLARTGKLLWSIHPFPSEIVSVPETGLGLAKATGSWGSAGAPTPTLGQLYFCMGFAGTALVFGAGIAFGKLERLAAKTSTALVWTVFWGNLLAFANGLHSELRSFTRFPLYLFVVIGIYRITIRLRTGKKRREGGSDAGRLEPIRSRKV